MVIEKNCLACGDLIHVKVTDHKRGWGNFCDKACAAAYKCGQRPKDVNERHVKYSIWAKCRVEHFMSTYGSLTPPKAKSIVEQIGKVKIKKQKRLTIPPNWNTVDTDWHEDAMSDMESGWNGHKVWN